MVTKKEINFADGRNTKYLIWIFCGDQVSDWPREPLGSTDVAIPNSRGDAYIRDAGKQLLLQVSALLFFDFLHLSLTMGALLRGQTLLYFVACYASLGQFLFGCKYLYISSFLI